MSDSTKSVEQLLLEVRNELARLNGIRAPSMPRFAIDGALRIVQNPQNVPDTLKPEESSAAA